jgi:NAD(P)-dependent dehydrogenase (short-subunit alcohol dehydrogenase family)
MALSRVVLVTGAGSGIGAALTARIARAGDHVVAVGRRESALLRARAACGESARNVDICAADVSQPKGRAEIVAAVQAAVERSGPDASRFDIVHNAGRIGHIGSLSKLPVDDFRRTLAVNVEAPLFLTQALRPSLGPGSRILHVGSGAAHTAYGGWHGYCASKAALHMLYNVLRGELAPEGILVGSVRPGIVATPMMNEILSAPDDGFPNRAKFERLQDNAFADRGGIQSAHAPPLDGLDTADNAAAFLDWLLRDTGAEEFPREEWDIRDPAHHGRWIGA